MLLGARQFFERRGGGGWQNPYVTDGLVAMWDGVWNAGPGVHDSTITDWVDLTGNGKSFHADAPIWSDNHCTCDGTFASCFHCATAAESQWFFDLLATGVYTIEFLFERREAHGNGTYFTCGFNNTYTPGFYTRYNGATTTNAGFYLWLKGGNRGEIFLNGTNYLNAKLYDISCSGDSCQLFLNGEGKKSNVILPLQTAINIDTSGGKGNLFRYAFFCRGDGYSVADSLGGRLYRLAIYSKSLTTDEVDHNCATDKARFNLP